MHPRPIIGPSKSMGQACLDPSPPLATVQREEGCLPSFTLETAGLAE